MRALDMRGRAIAVAAAERARTRVAAVLLATLPGIAVTIDADTVVLTGRISADDPRLRWIGSLLR